MGDVEFLGASVPSIGKYEPSDKLCSRKSPEHKWVLPKVK
jgi:hypothetical protein